MSKVKISRPIVVTSHYLLMNQPWADRKARLEYWQGMGLSVLQSKALVAGKIKLRGDSEHGFTLEKVKGEPND